MFFSPKPRRFCKIFPFSFSIFCMFGIMATVRIMYCFYFKKSFQKSIQKHTHNVKNQPDLYTDFFNVPFCINQKKSNNFIQYANFLKQAKKGKKQNFQYSYTDILCRPLCLNGRRKNVSYFSLFICFWKEKGLKQRILKIKKTSDCEGKILFASVSRHPLTKKNLKFFAYYCVLLGFNPS